jgi:hypothetical protein
MLCLLPWLPLTPSGLSATSPKFDDSYFLCALMVFIVVFGGRASHFLAKAGWGLFPLLGGIGFYDGFSACHQV